MKQHKVKIHLQIVKLLQLVIMENFIVLDVNLVIQVTTFLLMIQI